MSFGGELNTILVATDGSPSAQEACTFARELAFAHDAALIFVHVVRTHDFAASHIDEPGYAVPHEPTEQDHAVLAEEATRAADRGVRATSSLRHGSAIDEIVTHAETCDADLIIVGTKGHGRMVNAVIGSVSLGVLHRATCPVLIVRGAHATRSTNPSQAKTSA